MNLEDVFCEIKTDCCNIAHGWLPLLVIFDDHHLGTSMPSGGPSTPSVGGLVVTGSRPMPRHGHRRSPPATRRRALELLSGSADGMTEAMLVAHGFTVEQMVELIRSGLATATTGRVMAGARPLKVARVRITEAGRRALDARPKGRR
jgi:hypothetical protein